MYGYYLTSDEAREVAKDNKRLEKNGWSAIRGMNTYGKAVEIYYNGRWYLRSYETIVCSIGTDGDVQRHWDGWSKTTSNHVNAFLQSHNHSGLNKKDWENTDWYAPQELMIASKNGEVTL